MNSMLSYVCAWKDCRQTYSGDMPKGWISLVTFWSARPIPFLDFLIQPTLRDACLCPEHAQMLEEQLKWIGPKP